MKNPNEENVVSSSRAYGKNCTGAKSVNKDIMLSFKIANGDIVDYFLTAQDAAMLVEEIQLRLSQNEQPEEED